MRLLPGEARVRGAAASIGGLLLLGCASLAPRLAGDVDDYAGYRRTRTAVTVEGRLRTSWAYLRRRPRGRWHAEVKEWFVGHEARYFEASKDSLPRLRRYLETMPDGPHAAEAAERIVQLEIAADTNRRRERVLVAFARDIEDELALAANRRRAFVRTFSRWVGRISAISTWGERTSALSADFLREWRVVEPAARCVGNRCTKAMSFRYAIPDEHRLMPRMALMDVSLHLERGGVARAELNGPELFSRIGEAVQLASVSARDPQARAEAIARAVQLVRSAVDLSMPEKRCGREAVSPVVLVRECGGVRLTVTAGATPEEEDRIQLGPIVLTRPSVPGTVNPIRSDSRADDRTR